MSDVDDCAGLAGTAGVLACDERRLVLRVNVPLGMSRRARLRAAAAVAVLMPLASAGVGRLLVPDAPWPPLAGIGLAVGLGFATMLLSELRLVALAGAEGVVFERFNVFTHRKSSRVVIHRDDLVGHDVQAQVESVGPGLHEAHAVLRLHGRKGPIEVWTSYSPEAADLAGRRIRALLARHAP